MEPYLSSVVLCGGLLRDAASEAIASRNCCRRSAAGTLKVALACYEAPGAMICRMWPARAAPKGAGWQLSGQKTVVLDGPSADFFLVIGAQQRKNQRCRTACRCFWCRAMQKA